MHWGTFSLALHAWDEPAETLLALAPRHDAQLVMPHLGEAVEPAHAERVVPWWRSVAARGAGAAPEADEGPSERSKALPLPLD